MKIFGREPAAFIGLISGLLSLLLSLNLLGLTNESVGLLMAVVTAAFGVYTAWKTKDTMLGVIVGFVNATFAMVAGFGFELSPDTTAAAIAIVTVLVGFFQRTQTTPLVQGSFNLAA